MHENMQRVHPFLCALQRIQRIFGVVDRASVIPTEAKHTALLVNDDVGIGDALLLIAADQVDFFAPRLHIVVADPEREGIAFSFGIVEQINASVCVSFQRNFGDGGGNARIACF